MKNRQIKNGKWMKAFSMLLAAQLAFTTAGAPVYATGIETETVAETENETETAAETQVETEIESEIVKETEAKTEIETAKETKAETEAETKTVKEAKPKTEAESEAVKETGFEMETEDETVKEAKTEQETVKETRTEPETLKEAETETQTEPETLEEIELETQTELETAAAEIAQAEPITVSISSTKITPETTSITVNISSVPSMGILRVVQMDAEDVYESSKLNSYKSLHFSSAESLKAGENTLVLTASAEVGKKVLVVLRDSSGSSIVDAVSEPVMATVASQGGGEEPGNTKTPQEILLKDGQVLASTDPVTIAAVPDFTVAAKNVITTKSTEANFEVTANDTSITKILLAALCRVDENGKADAADSNSYVARLFQQTPGTLTFQIPENANLKAGEKLRLVLKYNNGNSVFEGEDVMVQAPQAENSIVIQEKEVYTDTETFTVTVSGYEEMVNGYLFLSTGFPSTDGWGDSRTRLGSKRFTGAGTYTFQVLAGSLKKGNTVQAYLYKYDIDNDSTRYEYSESVAIAERNPVAKESTIEIVTDAIRADRTDVRIKADFADDLTGTVKLYTYEGGSFDAEQAEEIYSGTVKASENSQKVSFGSGKLTAGKNLAAVLYLSDNTFVVSQAKVIQAVPEKKAPSVQFTSAKVTPGMNMITAKADFDSSESSADYVVYQFTGETLDKDTAEVLYQGTTTYYGRNSLTIHCREKLKEGAKLQIVLTAGEKEAVSNVLEVQPAPDWGTPYAAFEVSAVKSSDKTVDVTVDYADEYLSLGEDFYCDVTIYQFSGDYTDKEFEDKEMWERLDGSVTRVAQINSNFGDETKGKLTLTFKDSAVLTPGNRLIIKLRLPHTEWEGEEVDYLSESVPILDENETAENSIVIQEKEVYTDTETFTVTVSGYEEMVNGYLFLSTGFPSTDGWGDSRTRLGSKRFTGAGTYTFQVLAGSLKKGNTVQAYLYKYDIDNDSTRYEYSESVAIAERNPVAKESTIEIVTDAIRADRTDVRIKADFADDLTGTVKLYTYEGGSFDAEQAEEIYSGTVKASENSQKVSFGSGKLTAGKNLAAVLYLSDNTFVVSQAKVIQAVPEKKAPSVQFTSAKVTPGMNMITAKADFDSSESSADYVVYQFTGETLDKDTAEVLYQGTTTYYGRNSLTIHCREKLKEGAKLQIVLTAGEKEAVSNVLEVQPAPDWGTPYAAFEVSAVKSSDKTVDVTVDYADEYLSLGEDFYCDVTIYQFSGDYTDKEFEDKEMWERLDGSVTRVAQINSNFGDETKGKLTLTFKDSAVLTPGNRLIVKLRLPHTEWEGEEVDYLSESVPILDENETIVPAKVLLYNLGEDTSLGARLRSILESLGIQAEDVSNSQLNQKVGYLSGQSGYTENKTPYEGEGSDAQFMLMANFSSAQVDRFLAAMSAQGIRIDHKAVITAYNADYEFHQLIDDIKDEHEVFQALLELNQLVKDGENLEDGTYGQKEQWAAFQEALKEGNDLLKKEEPSAEELQNASAKLKTLYLELTGMKALEGNAVLTITEEEGGTYTITASLKGADAEETYTFTWNSGETGAVLTGVPAEELAGKIVTITGENRYGKTSGQLQVPGVPEVTVTPKKTGLTVNVVPKEAEVNRPKADTIRIRVYENGTLKGEKTLQTDGVSVQTAEGASQELSAEFEGLTADAGYIVKVYAVSPVGRSDTAVTPARTLKEETDESETKPSESETDESETKPSESETDESETKSSESETDESETKPSESETNESETKAPETEESESQKETEAETETEKQTEADTETPKETETETTNQTETETETETTKQTETESESEKQTEQNASGEQKNDSGKGNGSSQKTDAAKNGENAKTADQNNMSMWLLLLAVSGSIAAAAFRRKREK